MINLLSLDCTNLRTLLTTPSHVCISPTSSKYIDNDREREREIEGEGQMKGWMNGGWIDGVSPRINIEDGGVHVSWR